ncbi:diaminopimelate epimerase [Methylocella silvestris]|uniref:Diaminopimelate epimerase n=1 Tax=Methylocella silvestris TaxID=199596 RepID=A0A2J7TIX2_METSI|nr:diaminopimelate epimerase [Methylocella silvestris]PNG26696.1 diaminopimelate epimerase [Methylocella silvestris]
MNPLADRLAVKMNGIGNEILILDLRGAGAGVTGAQVRAIARTKGLGFDQLMVLEDPRSEGTKAFVTIFNADGSQSSACGNGTRCVAWALLKDARDEIIVETAAGRLVCRRVSEQVFSVEMGRPRLKAAEIPLARDFADTSAIDLAFGPADAPILKNPAVVNMGNPHAIFFVDDISAYDLAAIGPALEHDALFPERANISLARVVSPERIELKVWERGVGLTRACGSAACAALVAAARLGLAGRRATVALPGGELDIFWRESDDMVIMTGPVEFEFETRLDPAIFADVAA